MTNDPKKTAPDASVISSGQTGENCGCGCKSDQNKCGTDKCSCPDEVMEAVENDDTLKDDLNDFLENDATS